MRLVERLLELFVGTEGDGRGSDGLQGGLAVLGQGQRAHLHHHPALQELLHTRHGHHPEERPLNVLHLQDGEIEIDKLTTRMPIKAILTPLKRFIFMIPMLSGILYQPLLNNGLGLNSDYLTKVKAYNASSFIR